MVDDEGLTFSRIAGVWSLCTEAPAEWMIDGMVRAFFRRELIGVFIIEAPLNVRASAADLGDDRRGDFVFRGASKSSVGRMTGDPLDPFGRHAQQITLGDDGAPTKPTALPPGSIVEYTAAPIADGELVEHPVDRHAVARLFGGRDGTPEVLALDVRGWQQRDRDLVAEWRVRRDDFARWYVTAPILPRPALEMWWPPLIEALPNPAAAATGTAQRPASDSAATPGAEEPIAMPTEAPAAMQPVVAAAAGKPRRSGRPPVVHDRIVTAIRADIESGNLTRETLAVMQEKELATRYQASRNTCRKARKAVLPAPSPE